MTFVQSLLPHKLPHSGDTTDDLRALHERFLQSLFIVFALFILGTAIFSYTPASVSGKWTFFVCSAVLFICLLFLIFLRSSSYGVRLITTLIFFFFYTNLIFTFFGWSTFSLVLLLCFSLLCPTFLFRGPSKIGSIISLTTLLIWAVLSISRMVSADNSALLFLNTGRDILIISLVGLFGNNVISSLLTTYLLKISERMSLQESNLLLDQKIAFQTDVLSKRLNQILIFNDVFDLAGKEKSQGQLFSEVAELLKRKFDLYYVGIFLIGDTKDYADLVYGTGDAGKKMKSSQHRLAVGGYSMIGKAIQTGLSRWSDDVLTEKVHFENPYLPKTRSELALPMASSSSIFGALTIQSDSPNAFLEPDIAFYENIADILAIYLEKNSFTTRVQKLSDELNSLNRSTSTHYWDELLKRTGDIYVSYENAEAPMLPASSLPLDFPIQLHGVVVGGFSLNLGFLTQEKRSFIDSIVDQASQALENVQKLNSLQVSSSVQRRLNDLSSQMSKAVSIEGIVKTATQELGSLPSVVEASISLVQLEGNEPGLYTDREVK